MMQEHEIEHGMIRVTRCAKGNVQCMRGPKPLLAQKKKKLYFVVFLVEPLLFQNLALISQPNPTQAISILVEISVPFRGYCYLYFLYMVVFIYVSMNLLIVTFMFTNINFNSTYFISLNIS